VVRQRAAAVQQLQDQVESLTAQAAPGSAEVARLRAEAARLAPTVGTQAVTGPSLSVSLDDAHRTAASLPDRSEPVCADTAGSDLQDRLAAGAGPPWRFPAHDRGPALLGIQVRG